MTKITYRFSLLLIALATFACQTDRDEAAATEPTVDLKDALRGTWQTFQINVAVNSADGRDTFRTVMYTQEVWEQGFNMEPPVYYFQPDQKYRLVHRSLDGTIVDQTRGIWNVFGDTLVLIEPERTTQYQVRLANGKATFRNFQDWDEDGEADDEFQGLQRQISIGTEE